MPKEQAKAQLRALYAAMNRREGAGWTDDIWKSLQEAYNEVADMDSASWKKVKSVGDLDSEFWVTQHLPADAQTYLDAHKGDLIKQVIIRKAPVVTAIETALEAASLGKWEDAKKKMGYDTMFHLSLILNSKTILEKLARINIGTVDSPPHPEYQVVDVKTPISLGQVVEKTKAFMGGKFYPYDPFQNNCQDFVVSVLQANRDVWDVEPADISFAKQTMDEMIRDLPAYLPSFARTITSLGGLTGGAVPLGQHLIWEVADSAYKKGDKSKAQIGDLTLLEKTDGLVLYSDGEGTAFVGVRGTRPTDTDDLYADSLIPLNQLGTAPRYERDSGILTNWHAKYPTIKNWFGIGHSLGGAMVDEFMRAGLVEEGFSFNPAIQPRDYVNPKHARLYKEGDPLYDLFGRRDPNAALVPREEESWLYWIWRNTSLPGKLYDYLVSHKLGSFGDLSGGSLSDFKSETRPIGTRDDVFLGGAVDVETLFAALEGGAYAPKDLYTTAETRLPGGAERPAGQRRDFVEVEKGLRAIAHLDERVNPLAAFGARLMADDLYEHRTGENVDPGHSEATRTAFQTAFRESRSKQMEALDLVEATMKKYGLKGKEGRQTAYKYITGDAEPPKAKAAEAKVDEAELARLRKDYEEAESKRDQERAVKEAALLEEKKRREEADRAIREVHDRQIEEALEKQRAAAKILADQEAAAEAERQRIRKEEDKLEEEKRKAREKEAERAKQKKKKKAKKGAKEEEKEEEEEKPKKQKDPVLAKFEFELEAAKEAFSRGAKSLVGVEAKYGEAARGWLTVKEYGSPENTGKRLAYLDGILSRPNLSKKDKKFFQYQRDELTSSESQMSTGEIMYMSSKADYENFAKFVQDKGVLIARLEYDIVRRSVELDPPDEEFRETVEANVEEARKKAETTELRFIAKREKEWITMLELVVRDLTPLAKRKEEEYERQVKEKARWEKAHLKELEGLREKGPSSALDTLESEYVGHKANTDWAKLDNIHAQKALESAEEDLADQKVKSAGLEKGLKGRGQHSPLAQALGHLSVSKERLEEMRRRRANASTAAAAQEVNSFIQNVAKPHIQKQVEDIRRRVETGKGKKGKGKFKTRARNLMSEYDGRVTYDVRAALLKEAEEALRALTPGAVEQALEGALGLVSGIMAVGGGVGAFTGNIYLIPVMLLGFAGAKALDDSRKQQQALKAAVIDQLIADLEEVAALEGAGAQLEWLKNRRAAVAKTAEAMKKAPQATMKDFLASMPPPLPKYSVGVPPLLTPGTVEEYVRKGADLGPRFKFETEPTGVNLHPGRPRLPGRLGELTPYQLQVYYDAVTQGKSKEEAFDLAKKGPESRPPRPPRPTPVPPPAELRTMKPYQVQVYYDEKRKGKSDEEALEAARKTTDPVKNPQDRVLLQQLTPAELQMFYDLRRETPGLGIREAIRQVIQRRKKGGKKTVPKEGSVRKPYVGKVMKEAFMSRVAGRPEKEVRNLFNKAKRMYKAGGLSWEEVVESVLA